MLSRDPELACEEYGHALDTGFDEYWVRYNRGQLYAALNRPLQAHSDLARALELRPGDSATAAVMNSLAGKSG